MPLRDIILKPNEIYLDTGMYDYDSGITIPLSGQYVSKLGYKYLLQPSGTIIEVGEDIVDITLPGGIKIRERFFSDYGPLSYEEMSERTDSLYDFLNKESMKQLGKEVGMVSQLEMPNVLNRRPGNNKSRTLRRNLNHNAKGVIASFLTGKTGSINSQTNKLQQNIGIAMAPRPRKRQTRRRRRCRA